MVKPDDVLAQPRKTRGPPAVQSLEPMQSKKRKAYCCSDQRKQNRYVNGYHQGTKAARLYTPGAIAVSRYEPPGMNRGPHGHSVVSKITLVVNIVTLWTLALAPNGDCIPGERGTTMPRYDHSAML